MAAAAPSFYGYGRARKMTIPWESNASGAATVVIDVASYRGGHAHGAIMSPGTGGAQPSLNWNATLTDPEGMDVLNGKGLSLNNAADTVWNPSDLGYRPICGNLTLNITSAGNTKQGRVILFCE
jgi:hypothetical protein